jgi:hypothetical protein
MILSFLRWIVVFGGAALFGAVLGVLTAGWF